VKSLSIAREAVQTEDMTGDMTAEMTGEMTGGQRTLVIACGALARELQAITERHRLDIEIECLPAILHNRPSEIPEAVRARIARARERSPGDRILVGYADCGTGGHLARVCAEEGVEMLEGAHCYQFFATSERFEQLQDDALGSFYLTDFLVRHFDRLIWEGLGLAEHPELRSDYFGNYTRLVYLAQTDDPSLVEAAEAAAERLGLELTVVSTDYGELEPAVVNFTGRTLGNAS
jgi:hypothetical protein